MVILKVLILFLGEVPAPDPCRKSHGLASLYKKALGKAQGLTFEPLQQSYRPILEKSLEKFLEKIWIEDSTLFHRDNGK
jgi:hypothetical protein